MKFKERLEEDDEENAKFFIYRVNNAQFNNGKPTMVFKSSAAMADIALRMDVDGGDILSQQWCYVDATYDRVQNMKTITLWVEHPAYQKLLRIAVMDAMSEDYETMVVFFETLNDMLSERAGKIIVFNPRGMCADENSGTWNAAEHVFSLTFVQHRMTSCEIV